MSISNSLLYISKYLLIGGIALMIACSETEPVSEDGVFGEGVKNETSVDMKSLVSELSAGDTVRTTLLATVDEVCQKKGCWMTLHDDTSDDEIMVRFKDYGFFVPKDIGGRKVLVEGKAYTTVVPVEELRHYAEDAGKSEEEIRQITEPEKSYRFEATGVKLLSN